MNVKAILNLVINWTCWGVGEVEWHGLRMILKFLFYTVSLGQCCAQTRSIQERVQVWEEICWTSLGYQDATIPSSPGCQFILSLWVIG